MAKYKLNKQGTKVVDCDVLCESGRDGYVVRMGNGEIRNVRKRDVRSLNEMDNAVLGKKSLNEGIGDEIVKYGQKVAKKAKDIARAVKDLVVKAFNAGEYVFFAGSDGILEVSHPINAMAAASEVPCVNFYPGDTVRDYAEKFGIEPRIVENFTIEDTPYNGDYTLDFNGSAVSESVETCSVLDRICEDVERLDVHSPKVQDRKGNFKEQVVECNRAQLMHLLKRYYKSNLNNFMSDVTLPPYLILGAPGVGKTAVISSLCKELGKESKVGEPSMITLNASTVGPDSFMFPGRVEKEVKFAIKEKIKDVISWITRTSKKEVIDDLPKAWMPVYNPNQEDKDAVFVEDCLANGGYVDDDGRPHQGPGGVIFIDELTRITDAGLTTLMPLMLERHFGNRDLTLGSRWIVVAAANRKADMGDMADRAGYVAVDSAGNDRFRSVNYVPTFKEWKEWALSPMTVEEVVAMVSEDTGDKDIIKTNLSRYFAMNVDKNSGSTKITKVIPNVIEYLNSNPEDFHRYEIFNDPENSGSYQNALSMGGPRGWAQVSKILYENIAETGEIMSDPELLKIDIVSVIGQELADKFMRSLEGGTQFNSKLASEAVKHTFIANNGESFATDRVLQNAGVSEDLITASHSYRALAGPVWKSKMNDQILPILTSTLKSEFADKNGYGGVNNDAMRNAIQWIASITPFPSGAHGDTITDIDTDLFTMAYSALFKKVYGKYDISDPMFPRVLKTFLQNYSNQ